MFIQTESTPNPLSLKFMVGRDVSPYEPVYFSNIQAAAISPLAQKLFSLQGVTSVFFGHDFITITKDESKTWDLLKTEVLTTIMDHLVCNEPIFTDDKYEGTDPNIIKETDSEIVKQIKELILTRVVPGVAADGGNVIFRDFKDGIVYLELQGACSGCPSSTITLKNGIENMIKFYVPEVESVEAVS